MSDHLPPVETRFKPGESGNPAGRPLGARSRTTIVRDLLEALHASGRPNVEVATAEVVKKALNGDVNAWEKLMDSGYGKITDKLDTNVTVSPLTSILESVAGTTADLPDDRS